MIPVVDTARGFSARLVTARPTWSSVDWLQLTVGHETVLLREGAGAAEAVAIGAMNRTDHFTRLVEEFGKIVQRGPGHHPTEFLARADGRIRAIQRSIISTVGDVLQRVGCEERLVKGPA